MKVILFKAFVLLGFGFIYNSATAQTDCKEEKVGKTYFSICSSNIVTEKKKLYLETKAVPKKIDNKNTYKVVHYYVADRKSTATDEIFLEYVKFINNLETHTFYLNGKEFTGVLKIAVPFKNEGKSALYSGYDLLTYEFREGKFVSKSKTTDVELEKEVAVKRPT